MIKFYRIFLLIITFIFLSTYSPNKFEKSIKNYNTFFNVKKIIILDNILVSKDNILRELDHLYEKNIFFIKRKDMVESLKNVNFLKKIEVKKKYPDRLIIKLFESKPLALLFKDKTKYIIDSESNLILPDKKMNFPELPHIIGDAAENHFIDFYNKLETNGFPKKNIKTFYYFKIGRWDLELLDNRIIKFPYNAKNNIIKKSIELIKRDDFENYKIIDLRIDGKIIVE